MKTVMNMSDSEVTFFNKVVSLSEGKVQDKEKWMRSIYNATSDCTGLDLKVYLELYDELDDENWDVFKSSVLIILKEMGYDKYEPYKKIKGMDLSKMFK